ncbi:MAG: AAA family ATPase [Planctomycetota bacterium]|nr:AAA family ATPase [Planctomycetota bacterium]
MKIQRLEIEGFRSIRQQIWAPGDLNVVIGPNASGKTNLLRGLELLQAAASGGLDRYVQSAGGMGPMVWDGTAERVRLRVVMSPPRDGDDIERQSITYDLTLARLGRSGSYRIEYESLANYHRVENGEFPQPFKFLERDPNHAVVFSPEEKRLEAIEEVPEQSTLLSLAAGPFSANRVVNEFQRELAGWRIHHGLHTHREAEIRATQVARREMQVSADGQNLVTVLHSLYTGDRDFKNQVNDAMRAAFGDDFEELVFPPAADQRIQLRIRWRSLRQEQSAADLSDGTLRFLFLLAVLAIFTTHSAELLDSFGDQPPTTTIVQRVDGATCLRVVAGDDLAYWLKDYSLGSLYRSLELEAMS